MLFLGNVGNNHKKIIETHNYRQNSYFLNNEYTRYDFLCKKYGRDTRRIDQYKVFPKYCFRDPVKIDLIKNIDWSKQHQQRAGVIIYKEINGQLVFGLGVDTDSNNLTDFGGGVTKKDINPINGGLREFVEETLGVFGSFNEKEVGNCLVIYSEHMLIMFLHLDFDIDKSTYLFKERLKHAKRPEIKELMWMTKNYLFSIIEEQHDLLPSTDIFTISKKSQNPEMYGRVQIILNSAISIYGDFTHKL